MIQLGVGSMLETDPNWDHDGHTPRTLTRRYVIAVMVMIVALILIGLPFIAILLTYIGPEPLTYKDTPWPICSPVSTDECLPLDTSYAFQPGDVIPILATRCIDTFGTGQSLLPFHVDRNVTSLKNGVRVILPDFATAASDGCTTSISVATQLPTALAPGDYFLEGVATTYGRFRTTSAYWRTQTFKVRTPE